MLVFMKKHTRIQAPFQKPESENKKTRSTVLLREKALLLPEAFGFNQASMSLRHWSALRFGPVPITLFPTIQFMPKLPYLPLTGLDT